MSTMIRAGCLLLLCATVAAEPLPEKSADKHMGVATCAASQCHGSAIPRDATSVLQNEYVTWTQSDPHSGAYETLSNPESNRIATRLGLASARDAEICLDCHADNVEPAKRGERFQLSDGVGCEACHGGSERWLSTHYNTPDVTHSDNLSAGLYPSENPEARATLCLSCHLGTENKFATHRIMAAGHPRLAFELDTFNELWQRAGRQPHYRVDDDYRERKTVYKHANVWATGVLKEARHRLALIDSDLFTGNGVFPELGMYDCHSCHQSMKSVQWRRLPRHGDAEPGMPFLTDGAFVMTLALAQVLRPDDTSALRDNLARLHTAGSRGIETTRVAAAAFDRQLSALEVSLRDSNIRERDLLRKILELGAAGNFSDYASAEQAFMAVQMLVFELDEQDLEEELGVLAESLIDDERYRPEEFAALLKRLNKS